MPELCWTLHGIRPRGGYTGRQGRARQIQSGAKSRSLIGQCVSIQSMAPDDEDGYYCLGRPYPYTAGREYERSRAFWFNQMVAKS